MSVETSQDRAAFFNVAEFGVAASYVPPGGGTAVACTVLLDRRDPNQRHDDGRPIVGVMVLQVRRDEIAAPAAGGTFTIEATAYSVASRPEPDQDRQVWTMWVE
jgi:hypothetical protein